MNSLKASSQGLFIALFNFYLYSSIHIALAAFAITAFSYASIGFDIEYDYCLFVGVSTLLLYSIHRIIGISKSASYSKKGRFAIIIKYRSHLILYSIASALYCIYAYYTFDWERRFLLIIPAVLSISYSLPIFIHGNRLRDFHWIKIFLVASCWALITCTIPLYEDHADIAELIWLSIERMLFIFAITIPFDIRDKEIDTVIGVKTLATDFSENFIKKITFVALIVASIISFYLLNQMAWIAIILTYILSGIFIKYSTSDRSDYYYTGLIDGLMILPYIILIIFSFL